MDIPGYRKGYDPKSHQKISVYPKAQSKSFMFLAAWIPDLWKERNKIIKDAIKKNISTWVFGYKSDKIT